MALPHDLELSTDDKAAHLIVFVNGREAAIGTGRISVPIKTGQRIRWFVLPAQKKANVLVVHNRQGHKTVVFDGRSDGEVTTELFVVPPAERRILRLVPPPRAVAHRERATGRRSAAPARVSARTAKG